MEREPRAKRPKPTMWRFGDSMGPCLECDGRNNNDRRCRYASKEACEADRAAPLAKKKETRWDVLSTALKRGMVSDDVPTVLEWKEDFLVADGLRLEDLSEEDRNNEALVRLAVRQNGLALEYASDNLKGNEALVRLAVRQNGLALQYASDNLKGNEALVGLAVGQNGHALFWASDNLKGNEALVRLAVRQNGLALQYASDNLKGNEALVGLAVRQNGLALEYASENLKGNEEVVRAAMGENPIALDYSPLWNVRSWVLKAMEQSTAYPKAKSRFFVNFTYADDKDVMLRVVYNDPDILLSRGSLSRDS